METTKLFWQDSHIVNFTAVIVEIQGREDGNWVILNHTAFYPEGGGQPYDNGHIESIRVNQVLTADDGTIIHRLDGAHDFKAGDAVTCKIDWRRRQEMMQQHTGQHILSQAFFQLYGAETKGFRITDSATEIDLTLEVQPEEIEQAVVRAQDLANSIVFENREIRIHNVTQEDALKLPLRKESFVADCIRVIEIDGYDWSPCGGTHAKRTGEVGLIAVRSWERAKRMTRVHFVCGDRALRDYRITNQIVSAIARKFTVGREESEAAVSRMMDENKLLSRRVRHLSEIAVKVEAEELLAATPTLDGLRIFSQVFENRDFDELKLLAHRLVDRDGVIALLATRERDMARLVFARSLNLPENTNPDMNGLMRDACEKLGGRGGGKRDFAQGGGPNVKELEPVLNEAQAMVKRP